MRATDHACTRVRSWCAQDVNDPAVVVTFPLLDEPETAFVAWTTTPWCVNTARYHPLFFAQQVDGQVTRNRNCAFVSRTLPSNLALCVHPDMEYIKIKEKQSGTQYAPTRVHWRPHQSTHSAHACVYVFKTTL